MRVRSSASVLELRAYSVWVSVIFRACGVSRFGGGFMGNRSVFRRLNLPVLVSALPLVIAWFYFIGRSYLEGYYSSFGVDYSFIRPDFHDALLVGAKGQAGMLGAIVALVLGLVAYLLSITFASELLVSLFRKDWPECSRLLRSIHKPWLWRKEKFAAASEGYGRRLRDDAVGPTALMMIGFILVSFGFTRQVGAWIGQEQIDALSGDRRSVDGALIVYRLGSRIESKKAYVIGCGEAACAFWQGEFAFQLPRASIVEIRSN